MAKIRHGKIWCLMERKRNVPNVAIWYHDLFRSTIYPNSICKHLGPLLLTWINFNPSMDK